MSDLDMYRNFRNATHVRLNLLCNSFVWLFLSINAVSQIFVLYAINRNRMNTFVMNRFYSKLMLNPTSRYTVNKELIIL